MMGNKKGWRASARLLSKICLLAFLIIFMLPCIVKADDAVYSTVGGAWVKVNDSTWTMDKDGDGKTDVTLLKEGDEWKYIFNVADDSSLYYAFVGIIHRSIISMASTPQNNIIAISYIAHHFDIKR